MKAGVEFIGFASVSLAAHLAVLVATVPEGAASGGSGGAQEVTIAAPLGAADAELAAMVRAWDKPVQMPPFEPTSPAPRLDASPDLPLPSDAHPAPHHALSLPRLPGTDAAPQVAADLPELFSAPQTRDTPRPRARPVPQRAAPQTAGAPRASRAAGQGAQPQSGAGRAAAQSGAASDAGLLAQWGGGIRAAIQRGQRAPGTTARGSVNLRLQVNADGGLVSVGIAQGSGHPALDQAALRAVQRARLPRAPSGITGTHHFNLPLTYQ